MLTFYFLCLTAGIFSSLCYHLFFATVDYPRLIALLSSQKLTPPRTTFISRYTTALRSRLFKPGNPLHPTTNTTTPNSLESQTKAALMHLTHGMLGMSGAVYACIAITALAYPQAEVKAFFVFPLVASDALWLLVAFDVFGVLKGWR